jgi:hypothetical protein
MSVMQMERWLLAVMPLLLQAQPKPGDIFREYHYTSDMIVEFDPGSKRTDFGHAHQSTLLLPHAARYPASIRAALAT